MREGVLGLAIEFDDFVRDLLLAEDVEIVERQPIIDGSQYDLLVRRYGQLTVIELKALTPQTQDRLHKEIAKLKRAAPAIQCEDEASSVSMPLRDVDQLTPTQLGQLLHQRWAG